MRLPAVWDLAPGIKERFGFQGAGKQRAMVEDGHLLLVLHKAPQRDKRKREEVFFWRQPDGEWACSGRGTGLQALRNHVKEYNQAEETFHQEYAQAETAEDYFRILEAMTPLHHATTNLHATLQAAREGIPHDRELIDLRDWAYALERNLDLLYMDAKNALDFHVAKKSEEQAKLSMQSIEIAQRLNLLAAIFFPLTAIASVFGMNLPSGMEETSPWAFWLVFVLGTLSGFGIREWLLRGVGKKKQKR